MNINYGFMLVDDPNKTDSDDLEIYHFVGYEQKPTKEDKTVIPAPQYIIDVFKKEIEDAGINSKDDF